MRFLCNNCEAKISTKHFWEEFSIICPNCGKSTELKYRVGQSIPWFECDITFSDFKQLLTNRAYSKTVDPVIKELLGCSIERTEMGVKLIGEDGSLIPLEVAHVEIQLDSAAQILIYNTAMGLWR
jgi:hypothetical protein